jgi:hypothetical protein
MGVIEPHAAMELSRISGPLYGPGRQRSHASAGQQDRPEGEDQLGPTTSHFGPCHRRTPEDPADEPDVLY